METALDGPTLVLQTSSARRQSTRLSKILGLSAVVTGATVLFLATAADFLGLGDVTGQLGAGQALGIVLGVLAVAVGVALNSGVMLVSVVGRVRPTLFACSAGILILALGALGLRESFSAEFEPRVRTGFLDLDGESTLPAAVSAGLVIGAAILAFVLADLRPRMRNAWAFWALGCLFAYMGLDEGLAFHERLERAVRIDWLILYIPLILACFVASLAAVQALGRLPPSRRLFVGGALAWFTSVALEAAQWLGHLEHSPNGYRAEMVSEELLEMIGSTLFALALLVAVQQAVKSRSLTVASPEPHRLEAGSLGFPRSSA